MFERSPITKRKIARIGAMHGKVGSRRGADKLQRASSVNLACCTYKQYDNHLGAGLACLSTQWVDRLLGGEKKPGRLTVL